MFNNVTKKYTYIMYAFSFLYKNCNYLYVYVLESLRDYNSI